MKILKYFKEFMNEEKTSLDDEFYKIVADNLRGEDKDTSYKWANYDAACIELQNNYLDEYDIKELKYRITDGEDPKIVILSIIDKIDGIGANLLRLKNKIKEF